MARWLPVSRNILLICSLWVCCGVTSSAETLTVYGDDNYLPVIYSQDGKPSGALVNILHKVSERTGDVYDIQLFPWKRAYELARSGSGAIVGISLTNERREIFDFSEPIYNDDIQIVVLKGHEFTFNRLEDLKGKSVGGVLGASYGEVVDKAIQDGLFKVDRDVGQAGRLRKLMAGRIDAAFIGNGSAGLEAVLQSDPQLASKRASFVVLKTPLTRDPLHLAAAKSLDKKAVIERFNAAVRNLQKSDSHKKNSAAGHGK
jgi:ABC-type amino acid transport substrate-binding protein